MSDLKRNFPDLWNMINEATAGEEAKRLGLTHKGWGRYADKSGKIVAKSQDGKLVRVKGASSAQSKGREEKPTNHFDQTNDPLYKMIGQRGEAAFKKMGIDAKFAGMELQGEVEVYEYGDGGWLKWNNRTKRWLVGNQEDEMVGEGGKELVQTIKKLTQQNEMRDGLPPKDPGREGKGKSYFNQAKSKNLAQANKKYTAEEKKTSVYRKALKFNESIK